MSHVSMEHQGRERLLKPISVGTSVRVFYYILSCGIKGLRKFKEKYPLYLALGSGHENYSHVEHDSKVPSVDFCRC